MQMMGLSRAAALARMDIIRAEQGGFHPCTDEFHDATEKDQDELHGETLVNRIGYTYQFGYILSRENSSFVLKALPLEGAGAAPSCLR